MKVPAVISLFFLITSFSSYSSASDAESSDQCRVFDENPFNLNTQVPRLGRDEGPFVETRNGYYAFINGDTHWFPDSEDVLLSNEEEAVRPPPRRSVLRRFFDPSHRAIWRRQIGEARYRAALASENIEAALEQALAEAAAEADQNMPTSVQINKETLKKIIANLTVNEPVPVSSPRDARLILQEEGFLAFDSWENFHKQNPQAPVDVIFKFMNIGIITGSRERLLAGDPGQVTRLFIGGPKETVTHYQLMKRVQELFGAERVIEKPSLIKAIRTQANHIDGYFYLTELGPGELKLLVQNATLKVVDSYSFPAATP